MKKIFKSKTPFLILVFAIIATYNHCIGPTKSGKKSQLKFESTKSDLNNNTSSDFPPNSSQTNANSQSSIEAFGTTVHKVTFNRCKSCHGSFQQPLHAVADIKQAHDAVISTNKVKFSNPSQSRLVLKLKDSKHNCWSNCDDNANEMLNAITRWKEIREQNMADSNEDPAGEMNSLVTSESLTVEEELNKENTAISSDILLHAESGSLKSPMTLRNIGELGTISVANNGESKDQNDPTAGIAYFTFDASRTDYYKVYAFVDAPSGGDNSFWIKVNSGSYAQWHIDTTNGFEWREVTHTTSKDEFTNFIPEGRSQMLEVRQREDGTVLSKIFITSDPNINLDEVSGKAKSILSYSLEQILPGSGAKFEIDLEEFDSYSYKFSSPRITTNRSLRVKSVKLLINNEFNVQHSTYTLVDQVIPVGTTQLSNRSLIALKEFGNDKDKISFSFEILELR